jgi:hypothetical protein
MPAAIEISVSLEKVNRMMLDLAVAYNRYRFLGNQFLTWLWFLIENDQKIIRECDPDTVSLEVGNRMVLENRTTDGLQTISIKANHAGLEEAILSLSKGAAVTEIQLVYQTDSLQWRFNLKGENLSLSAIKLPDSAAAEHEEDKDGLILDRLYLYEKPLVLIDHLYQRFLQIRLSGEWSRTAAADIKKWMDTQRLRN